MNNTLQFYTYTFSGRKKIYERRMVRSDCYNGRDYERVIAVENCACDKSDFQCDFGFKQDDSWSTGKYSNKMCCELLKNMLN